LNLTALYGRDFLIKNALCLRPSIGLEYFISRNHNESSNSNPNYGDTSTYTHSTYSLLARFSCLKQFEHIFAGVYSDMVLVDITNSIAKATGHEANNTDYHLTFCLIPKILFGYTF
jgi:hypothetical protein